MPISPTYPGVYIQEIPSGVRTITGVATSITAFIGYTAQGPTDQAIRIQSFGDYTANFGGLNQESPVSYAVQQFFMNGGTDAYVVRVAAGGAAAQVSLQNMPAPGPLSIVLGISAHDSGVWGNNVSLEVDYLTSNPDSYFNLTVTEYQSQNGKLTIAAQEKFRNLSMNKFSSSFAPAVIQAGSQLIAAAMPGGLAWAAGWAMSTDLTVSATKLTASDTTITGILDSTTPFTLVLAGAVPTDAASLQTAVSAAITSAGLAAKLAASLTDATGTAVGGTYLKLASASAIFNSAVQITKAPTNDLSSKIGLGLTNGGREKEGASAMRPAPNGTLGGDLAVDIATKKQTTAGTMTVKVTDHAPGGASRSIVTATLAATNIDANLPGVLQNLIQATSDPALQQATVQMFGSFLNVVPSSSTPNISLDLTGGPATEAFGGPYENVQDYSLGTGATFGGQTGAIAGMDGTAPGAAQFLGDGANTGIYALLQVDLFNLLVIPETAKLAAASMVAVIDAAVALCEVRRAFMIVDPDPTQGLQGIGPWVSTITAGTNAGVFFPQVMVADPLNNFRLGAMQASGMIAGVFANTDASRGVWKAPAGIDAVLQGAQGLSIQGSPASLTDGQNGILNPLGINCLRNFPVYGNIIWGSRTLQGADAQASEWKYIPVRRTALYIEESLYRGTQWVVFEPNDQPLWAQIRLNVGAFMQGLFRQGAFQGSSPQQAYFVKCDSETTTQTDINNGIVNILVGFAPLKPAEFVIISIQQMASQSAA